MQTLNSIGVISKVSTNKIVIEIPDTNKINYNFHGDLYICEGINSFVTIYKSLHQKFIYQIINLAELEKPFDNVEEESKFYNKAYFEAIPIGEIKGDNFKFGLSKFPMIGNDVYLTDFLDMDLIFKIEDNIPALTLGLLASHEYYSPKFSLDKLLSNHMCVLGNTGSGKSTTVRKLLNEIILTAEEFSLDINSANFIIFDVHDEYDNLPDKASTITDVLKDISIPLDTLSPDDWINLVQPASAVQLPILMNGLRLANLIENNEASFCDWVKAYCALELYNNVHTEVVGKRTKIVSLLQNITDPTIKSILTRYSSQYGNFQGYDEQVFIDAIKSFIRNKSTYHYEDCSELILSLLESSNSKVSQLKNLELGIELTFLFEESKGNSQVRSYCSTLMTRISNLIASYSKSMFDNDQQKINNFNQVCKFDKGFTLFKVASLENKDLLFFTSYVLKIIYNNQKEQRSRNNKQVNSLYHFIFDEAHKYITESDNDFYNSIKIFEQIAKEGRKFGIFMFLASQRPGELSKTVLSQCNNFILHRIRSNVDLEQMRRSIPYISDSQLQRISYLITGSALLVGEAFSVPMEIIIKGEDYGYPSSTLLPSNVWGAFSKETD
ncbi:hypothetical protein C173_17056 [Paenibacillus sp. FSL R7-277]|uniref:ATP-binding protein n=1 Tax=Paenibacillus sp. FSL R7-277 TaxID=1227352 RepID=UPI0003E2934C|nr:ATP-binding protein [Paenibacillus sp. FSL R7-277]ETT69635.1 hypothetical protein C173_17056 [Paenibacillus sp. FSL R7-277]